MARIRGLVVLALVLAPLLARGAGELPAIVDVRMGQHPGFDRLVLELAAPAAVARAFEGNDLVLEVAARPDVSRRVMLSGMRRMGRVTILSMPDGARVRAETRTRRVRAFQLAGPPRLVVDFADPGDAPFEAPAGLAVIPDVTSTVARADEAARAPAPAPASPPARVREPAPSREPSPELARAPEPAPAPPEVAAPEVAVPEVAVPKVAAPEVATPKVAVPEVATPKIAAPEVATPKIVASEVAAPPGRAPGAAPSALPPVEPEPGELPVPLPEEVADELPARPPLSESVEELPVLPAPPAGQELRPASPGSRAPAQPPLLARLLELIARADRVTVALWLAFPFLLAAAIIWLIGRSRERRALERIEAPPGRLRSQESLSSEELLETTERIDVLEKRIDEEVRSRMQLEERASRIQEDLKTLHDRVQRLARRDPGP